MVHANQATPRLATAKGLVVNASTKSRSRAGGIGKAAHSSRLRGIDRCGGVFRHDDVPFVVCPVLRSGHKVQCLSCARLGFSIFAQADRGFVITCPDHGASAADL